MHRPPLVLAPVIPINAKARDRLYRDLLTLAEAARQGHITAIAYAALTPSGQARTGTLGATPHNAPQLRHGLDRLSDHLLYHPAPRA